MIIWLYYGSEGVGVLIEAEDVCIMECRLHMSNYFSIYQRLETD